MTWRDTLLPASFRGVPFEVEGHEHETGRRVAEHEYPNKDRGFGEDMGRRLRRYRVDAFLLGDDYPARRDALLDACEKPGPGTLVHPFLGEHTVNCRGVAERETARKGRLCRLELDFVEHGRADRPVARPDTGAALESGAASARQAIARQFISEFAP